jgi:hypothetical protein
MKKVWWVFLFLALAALFLGCCQNPEGPAKARAVLQTVAGTYYNSSGILKPQIKEMAEADKYVALGAKIADQALALAGALSEQNCPDPKEVAAAQAKAAEAKRLADQAGVK